MTYIFKGDIGVDVTCSTGKDLTSVSATHTIKVKKPGGTTATWLATVGTPATGGTLTYTTETTDLNEAGDYYLQAYVVMADGDTFYGDVYRLHVYDLFEEP